MTRIVSPDTVDRFNVFPAVTILGNPTASCSSGQAIVAMQQIVAATLPIDCTIGRTGSPCHAGGDFLRPPGRAAVLQPVDEKMLARMSTCRPERSKEDAV